jgi:hypothetical protein
MSGAFLRGVSTACSVALFSVSPLAHAEAVDPSQLEVEIHHSGIRHQQFVVITGFVHNRSGQAVMGVRLHVDLFDRDGQPAPVRSISTAARNAKGGDGTDHGVVPLHYLRAGESTPFKYVRDVKSIRGTYASHKVTASARAVPEVEIPVLAVEKVKVAPKGKLTDWSVVAGSIKNVGTLDCRDPKPVIGIYDGEGKLFDIDGTSSSFDRKIFPAGATATFQDDAVANAGGETRVWATARNPRHLLGGRK